MPQPFNPRWEASSYDGPLDTDQSGISLKKINKLLYEGIRIDAGDINIGAVEIKNGTSDQRAVVNSAGSLQVKDLQTPLSTSSNAAVQTAAGTIATLAENQRLTIENLGTTSIKVKFGASAATGSYNFILAGGIAQDDGTGESVEIIANDDWIGAISVFGDAAIRYTSTVRS